MNYHDLSSTNLKGSGHLFLFNLLVLYIILLFRISFDDSMVIKIFLFEVSECLFSFSYVSFFM